MPSASAAEGGSGSGNLLPLRAIALSVIMLGAVIALCWAFFRHPVPAEAVLTGPWSICGTPIAAPFEVMDLDEIYPEEMGLMFGIRDGQGMVSVVSCPWTDEGADPERLSYYPSLPQSDGTMPGRQPLAIAQERAVVRNVLFHALAHCGFHGRVRERRDAYQLYPSCCDRLLFWLRGRP